MKRWTQIFLFVGVFWAAMYALFGQAIEARGVVPKMIGMPLAAVGLLVLVIVIARDALGGGRE
jgi:hypothetical protein